MLLLPTETTELSCLEVRQYQFVPLYLLHRCCNSVIELTVDGLMGRPKVRSTSVPFQDTWNGYLFITTNLQSRGHHMAMLQPGITL